MTERLTPYLAAKPRFPSGLARISATCSAVSLALPCASPRRFTWRPLAILSALLSAREPRNRCAGLTQEGLSQRCRTHSCPSQSGKARAYDIRWASFFAPIRSDPVRHRILPYPLISRGPVHSQQSNSPARVTWDQKTSIVLGFPPVRRMGAFPFVVIRVGAVGSAPRLPAYSIPVPRPGGPVPAGP